MNLLIARQNRTFYDYPYHKHDFWEVLLNFTGSGTAYFVNESLPFEPGTIFCIRPGLMHRKIAEDGFMDGSVFLQDFVFEKEKKDVFCFQDDESRSFLKLFELSYRFYNRGDVHSQRMARSLTDAMQELVCHWKEAGQAGSKSVEQFQSLLLENISNYGFDIAKAIEGSGYSSSYFRKLFKSATGQSPLAYLNNLRIQSAKNYLLQYAQTLTIQQIADMVGFRDSYYFSRMFKKLVGVSPRRFIEESKQVDGLSMSGPPML